MKPEHIAIIMDGNGRWARNRGLPRIVGHRAGVKALRKLIEYAVETELNAITVYAFSRENWRRPEKEVYLLMDLFMSALQSEVDELHKNNVRLTFIGDKTGFSRKLQDSMHASETLTASNSGLGLNVATNYSGQWDIVQAVRSMVSDKISLKELDESEFDAYLTLNHVNDPDLFIRTGGERRISNFFLWQLAYTELYFTDTLWPDFDRQHFINALDWFATRQRRFGMTPEQLHQSEQ